MSYTPVIRYCANPKCRKQLLFNQTSHCDRVCFLADPMDEKTPGLVCINDRATPIIERINLFIEEQKKLNHIFYQTTFPAPIPDDLDDISQSIILDALQLLYKSAIIFTKVNNTLHIHKTKRLEDEQ